MSKARDALCRAMDSVVGLTAPAQSYLDLISPDNTIAQQMNDAQKSDCIFTALGIEELVFDGLTHTSNAPQVQLEKRAGGTPMEPAGAMRHATFDNPPVNADAVWYGKSARLNAEHVEHVRRVVFSSSKGNGVLDVATAHVVAGGEKDASGNETIKLLVRIWRWKLGDFGWGWYDDHTDRMIIGVVDADLLAERFTLKAA